MNKQQELMDRKRGPGFVGLNSFRRAAFAAALYSVGEEVRATEPKLSLYARVMSNPRAKLALISRHSWQNRSGRGRARQRPCRHRAGKGEMIMTKRDKSEFEMYLHQCSDRQVLGVYDKETEANRRAYAALARLEMARRNID